MFSTSPLHSIYDDSCKQENIKVTLPDDFPFGYPTIIKHKGDYYLFSTFNFGFEPINYVKTKCFVDLDKVKDESLEEVLSKE